MASRTVRLDEEAETALEEIRATTGLPISETLKQGLHALQRHLRQEATRTPYAVFETLDLGPGGYARVPSTEVRRGVRRAIARKLGR